MGRKRKHDPTIPSHIDQGKLPSGVYWHKRQRYWYTSDGKGTSWIAGEKATLAELYTLIESKNKSKKINFCWLSNEYKSYKWFLKLAPKTQKNYELAERKILEYELPNGKLFGEIELKSWTSTGLEKILSDIEINIGARTAQEVLKYVRIVFRYGRKFKHTDFEPDVDPIVYQPLQRLPSKEALNKIIEFCKERGSEVRIKGSCPAYLWAYILISYKCRSRGFEVYQLNEGHLLDEGILCERAKGSKDNIVLWDEELKNAVQFLQQRNQKILTKKNLKHFDYTPLFMTHAGMMITKSGIESAWQRMVTKAIKEGIIPAAERFAPHDLKRAGTTYTEASTGEKLDMTGLSSAKVLGIYDKSLKKVKPAK